MFIVQPTDLDENSSESKSDDDQEATRHLVHIWSACRRVLGKVRMRVRASAIRRLSDELLGYLKTRYTPHHAIASKELSLLPETLTANPCAAKETAQ